MNIGKLSRSEEANVTKHLVFSLLLIFCLGFFVTLVGYSYYKPSMLLFGLFMSLASGVCYIILQLRDRKSEYLVKEKLVKSKVTQHEICLESAIRFFEPLREDFNPEVANWSKVGTINYLSLERIIEALKARDIEIKRLLSKSSMSSLDSIMLLLETALVFPQRLSKDIIDHKMPDIPSSSIEQSIKFLIQKLENEKQYVEKK